MTKQKQKGFSTLQVVASIAIAGVLTATAANILVPMFLQTELNAAYEELYLVASAVREVKEYEGNYTNMTNFQYLVTNGFIQTQNDSYTTGVNQNVYGNTITAVPATGGLNATITYTAQNTNQCENLERRAVVIAGVTTPDPVCAAAVLTVTIN